MAYTPGGVKEELCPQPINVMCKANYDLPLYLVVPSHAFHGIVGEIGLDVFQEVKIASVIVYLEREIIESWLTW